MTAGFNANTAVLTDQAARLSHYAEQAHSIHMELKQMLETTGACWGGDEAGRSFAESHVGSANSTLEKLNSLPGELIDVSGCFTLIAQTYQRTEHSNTSIFLTQN